LLWEEEVPSGIEGVFLNMVNRRASYEPIAYIIGYKEFYGREFCVNKSVLIPRPETELIIDSVLSVMNDNLSSTPCVLDLGTGSGAIAITVACELPNANIYALDISAPAIELAKSNYKKISADVSHIAEVIFMTSVWYSEVPCHMKFDIIISNPPYIPLGDKHLMSDETLNYEPHIALFAEEEGLSSYHQIFSGLKNYLKPEGVLIIEIGFNQYDAIVSMLEEYNLSLIKVHKDLQDYARVIIIGA
jgi:release factor glutamine methyltransferase